MATRFKYHWSIQVVLLPLSIATGYHLFQFGGASLLTVGITWGLTQGIVWQLLLYGIQSKGMDRGESRPGGIVASFALVISLIVLPAIIALLAGYLFIAASLCVVILTTYRCVSLLFDQRDELTQKHDSPA